MIRVVLADDQAMVRSGLRLILEAEPDIDVVGEAADGAAAVEEVRWRTPDVVLMDVQMPGMDGLEATRRIVAATPDARVVIVTTFDLDEYLFEALRAGASGFLLKHAPADELVAAVRTVAAGNALLAPAVTGRVIATFARRGTPAPELARSLDAAVGARARGPRARRPRTVERGDRRCPRRGRGHREDAPLERVREARAA